MANSSPQAQDPGVETVRTSKAIQASPRAWRGAEKPEAIDVEMTYSPDEPGKIRLVLRNEGVSFKITTQDLERAIAKDAPVQGVAGEDPDTGKAYRIRQTSAAAHVSAARQSLAVDMLDFSTESTSFKVERKSADARGGVLYNFLMRYHQAFPGHFAAKSSERSAASIQ